MRVLQITMSPPTRNLWKEIWQLFVKSLKVSPERTFGEYRGEDHLGNKYYELGPDPRGGRSRASRWYESKTDDFLQELPVEWMAWLRRQRTDPPTKAEIERNMTVSEMKKRNVEKMEDREYKLKPKPHHDPNSPFPRYKEYENFPGEHEPR